jgi:hypothetical protein
VDIFNGSELGDGALLANCDELSLNEDAGMGQTPPPKCLVLFEVLGANAQHAS